MIIIEGDLAISICDEFVAVIKEVLRENRYIKIKENFECTGHVIWKGAFHYSRTRAISKVMCKMGAKPFDGRTQGTTFMDLFQSSAII